MLESTLTVWLALMTQAPPPSPAPPPADAPILLAADEGEEPDVDEGYGGDESDDPGAEPDEAGVPDGAGGGDNVSPEARPYVDAPYARARFALGEGLSFDFAEGRHHLSIGGVIQPSWAVEVGEDDTNQILSARGAYLRLGADLYGGCVAMFVQADFVRAEPLLDAWVAWRPAPWVALTLGQRLTTTLGRESQQQESQLVFPDRSLLARTFSDTGRELGLFVDFEIPLGPALVRPQLSMTSGDGRNSFGADSRDRDIGGLKWGARLDVLPLGDFSEAGRGTVVDLAHETTPKLALGVAYSYNDGASEARGQGHGAFALYDQFGDPQQPDYRQLYADLLVKFQGASLLVEYANASATSLEGTFVDEGANTFLVRQQIAEYLALGDGLNVQLGYYFDFGLGVDVRYGSVTAEFADNGASVVKDATSLAANLAWYVSGQALKVQLGFEHLDVDGGATTDTAELLLQLAL